ncbi:MAG TPA: glycosyltransferase family 1 protein [Anaerolineae bacterium]|nr:glycosyltransferase family 1 protein [Anaerolineae bacterium]
MHIAFNAYFWTYHHAGSGQYVRQLVYHLNRYISDLHITLIWPQMAGESLPTDIPPSVTLHPVPIKPGHLGKVRFEQISFPHACQAIGADLAHVPYWGSPLRSPIPLVVTVHDIIPLRYPQYRQKASQRLYTALVTTSARGADHIITDSFASKLEIVDHFQRTEWDTTAIYLAAGPDYQPAETSLVDMGVLRKYDLPETYILYLGGYNHHKNIVTLLEAYTYVARALGPDYPLILAGKKPDPTNEHFPDYDAIIKQLNLEKYVRWIGFVDEEDKPILYRNAETFVFPSEYEGFGLPPLEALACGTPVVATTSSSLPEVIGDAGFTVPPNDEREMAGAIIATIMDEQLAASLRQKSQAQAAKFSWQQTAVDTLKVYDLVLNGPQKPPPELQHV